MMRFLRILLLLLFCGTAFPLASQQDTLATIFKNSFEVFQSLRNDKGIYRDSKVFDGSDFHPASTASIGMGLISLCIADAMGWIPDAANQALLTLESMLGRTPGFNPDVNANGYFRHWIDMETGARAWNSEYSTIDTGILLAGALFAKKYFCGNDLIGNAADELYANYNPYAAVANPVTGAIYLMMNSDGLGVEDALTLPFNEYMLIPWLSNIYDDFDHPGSILWSNHYESPDSLPKINFEGIELLTDNPDNYLSSFVIQFAYYLIHDFSQHASYVEYLKNARKADSTWWSLANVGEYYQWGLGAGSANYGSGYHADKIGDNPSHIHSPHIIAGFLPVSPGDTTFLKQQYAEGSNLYILPNGQNTKVLWRKSLDDPNYTANEIQGVDYSTMLFGLASLDRFLGKEFFSSNNDFFTQPCGLISSTKNFDPTPDLFNAFPNPSSNGIISIEMENEYRGPMILRVYDLLGRLYLDTKIQKPGRILVHDIDATSWSDGMYVIALIGSTIKGSQRVLKE